jgi:hypothetical protein
VLPKLPRQKYDNWEWLQLASKLLGKGLSWYENGIAEHHSKKLSDSIQRAFGLCWPCVSLPGRAGRSQLTTWPCPIKRGVELMLSPSKCSLSFKDMLTNVQIIWLVPKLFQPKLVDGLNMFQLFVVAIPMWNDGSPLGINMK